MKVSLFVTCLVDLFQGDVGKDTVEVLERLGCKIDFPDKQTCCGQPAFNSGYITDAMQSMKTMIQAFEHSEYVVTPSGSCAAMFKEYPHVFKDDFVWETRAKELADKTYELTEFIVNVLKVENVGAKLNGRATFHTSCHMTRLLGVRESPITLLKNVAGLEYVPLPHREDCCGFGGTFAVKMAEISEQMVDEKLLHIEEIDVDYLVGADAGCLLNIGGRAQRKEKPLKVMHIASVLNSR